MREHGKKGQEGRRFGKRDKENGDMGKETTQTRGRKTLEKKNIGMGDIGNKTRG